MLSSKAVFRTHTHCRVCGTELSKPYLDLGEQPLANALVPRPVGDGITDDTVALQAQYAELCFPLQVILCETCGLSQLSIVVDPEILYSGYRFRSGESAVWREHCAKLAEQCTEEFTLKERRRILDIAANDGTLLRSFSQRNWACYGVDPSPIVTDNPFPMAGLWAEYWSPELAAKLHEHNYSFDLIIAQNVLGHVDDPIGFLRAAKTVLAPEGRVVVEVPDFDVWRQWNFDLPAPSFDTIYHEHLSYWHETPLLEAATRAGLRPLSCERRIPIHGGSLRFWFMNAKQQLPDVNWKYLKRHGSQAFTDFAQRVEENVDETDRLLSEAITAGASKIWAWGASAKAAVYLNYSGFRHIPQVVIDDCAEKQGLLMPGTHQPVIAPPESLADVDVLWILSWNNADSIKQKAKQLGFRGRFLLTNGTPRLEE